MANAVYLLCALTSAHVRLLLFRLFWRHRQRATRLALWSSLSFAWFAVSNALVFVDLVDSAGPASWPSLAPRPLVSAAGCCCSV